MHAVNSGPAVRNHYASLSEPYGPQHVVDVHCIFQGMKMMNATMTSN